MIYFSGMQTTHVLSHEGFYAVAQVIGSAWIFVPRLTWEKAMCVVRELSDGDRVVFHASFAAAKADPRLAPLFGPRPFARAASAYAHSSGG